jgi:hypothetical protein
VTRNHLRTYAQISAMEPSNRDQAIWLARGAALGTFVGRLLRALRAGVGQLRQTRFGHRTLPKRP